MFRLFYLGHVNKAPQQQDVHKLCLTYSAYLYECVQHNGDCSLKTSDTKTVTNFVQKEGEGMELKDMRKENKSIKETKKSGEQKYIRIG